MTTPLDYAPPAPRPYSRPLAVAATATLAYPLLFAAAQYGEWLLAWAALGHPPVPSLNDPLDIAVSRWLYPVTLLAGIGLTPAACAALVLNVLHVIHHRPTVGRATARLLVGLALWIGLFALLWWDPYDVGVWWAD